MPERHKDSSQEAFLRFISLLLLCLLLAGCQVLPGFNQAATPTEANEDPLSVYRSFLQGIYDQPMAEIMAPHFVDYKDLPNAFIVSAALVDIAGDKVPEVLMAYSSDVPGNQALTYTQIYQYDGKKIVPLGTKIPLTIQYFGLNKLIGTAETVSGKQWDRIYQEYQMSPDVTKVAEETISLIAQNQLPNDQESFYHAVSLAKTMAAGTTSNELMIMDQPEQNPGFILFNTKTYDSNRLSKLIATFDLRVVNWQRLSQSFIDTLDKYYLSAGIATLPEAPTKFDVDALVLAIDREMNSGVVRELRVGSNIYYYVPELSIRGMQHVRIIKAKIDGLDVYLNHRQPIMIKQEDNTYYLGDEAKQSTFLSLLQRLRSDISRESFRRFLWLDAYDKAIPLVNYEFMSVEE